MLFKLYFVCFFSEFNNHHSYTIFVFDNGSYGFILSLAGLFAICCSFYKTETTLSNIIKKDSIVFLLYCFRHIFKLLFYPSILPYQSGMMAGKWLNNNYKNKQVKMYKCYSNSLEFYCNATVLAADNFDSLLQGKILQR